MGEEILPIPHPRFDLLSSPLLCGFLFFFSHLVSPFRLLSLRLDLRFRFFMNLAFLGNNFFFVYIAILFSEMKFDCATAVMVRVIRSVRRREQN